MITKSRKEDYYVINKMNLTTKTKERIKSNIEYKCDARLEMMRLASELGETLSDSGYFNHEGFYYGVDVSNKELDKL